MRLNNFLYFLLGSIFFLSCIEKEKDISTTPNQPVQQNKIHGFENPKSGNSGIEKNSYRPGEVLVKFLDGTEEKFIKDIISQCNLETIKIIPKLNVYHLRIKNDSSVEEVIKILNDIKEVEYSEPNYITTFQ